jgi:hypothetical protein
MRTFDFCLPTKSASVPVGPDWPHQIKYDGYRPHQTVTLSQFVHLLCSEPCAPLKSVAVPGPQRS